MNVIGRKWLLVLWSIPVALGFSCFVIANVIDDNIPLHVGRLLSGIISLLYVTIIFTMVCFDPHVLVVLFSF